MYLEEFILKFEKVCIDLKWSRNNRKPLEARKEPVSLSGSSSHLFFSDGLNLAALGPDTENTRDLVR